MDLLATLLLVFCCISLTVCVFAILIDRHRERKRAAKHAQPFQQHFDTPEEPHLNHSRPPEPFQLTLPTPDSNPRAVTPPNEPSSSETVEVTSPTLDIPIILLAERLRSGRYSASFLASITEVNSRSGTSEDTPQSPPPPVAVDDLYLSPKRPIIGSRTLSAKSV